MSKSDLFKVSCPVSELGLDLEQQANEHLSGESFDASFESDWLYQPWIGTLSGGLVKILVFVTYTLLALSFSFNQ